jgi:glycosyltransferase involved in cell wall biosynthesis
MKQLAIRLALVSCRFSNGARSVHLIRKILREMPDILGSLLSVGVTLESLEKRAVVMADPIIVNGCVARKGVLLVSFTETCGLLYGTVDRTRLAQLFHLVLEPSSSGYADEALLCWHDYPEAVLVQASEEADRKLLRELSTSLHPVSYGAGDWIDPSRFLPVDVSGDSRFDALCVANYEVFKRVHAFLRAVSYVARERPGYRAVLVLASLGKTETSSRRVAALIRWYRLEEVVQILEDIGREQLRNLYSSATVLVFPSFKEGSSRVIYEAMCCGTPVLVLAENIGVNKDHIRPETGMSAFDARLGAGLLEFSEKPKITYVRQWITERIGPENTTNRLLSDLNGLFPHEDWKQGELSKKANIPEATLSEPTRTKPLSYWIG